MPICYAHKDINSQERVIFLVCQNREYEMNHSEKTLNIILDLFQISLLVLSFKRMTMQDLYSCNITLILTEIRGSLANLPLPLLPLCLANPPNTVIGHLHVNHGQSFLRFKCFSLSLKIYILNVNEAL